MSPVRLHRSMRYEDLKAISNSMFDEANCGSVTDIILFAGGAVVEHGESTKDEIINSIDRHQPWRLKRYIGRDKRATLRNTLSNILSRSDAFASVGSGRWDLTGKPLKLNRKPHFRSSLANDSTINSDHSNAASRYSFPEQVYPTPARQPSPLIPQQPDLVNDVGVTAPHPWQPQSTGIACILPNGEFPMHTPSDPFTSQKPGDFNSLRRSPVGGIWKSFREEDRGGDTRDEEPLGLSIRASKIFNSARGDQFMFPDINSWIKIFPKIMEEEMQAPIPMGTIQGLWDATENLDAQISTSLESTVYLAQEANSTSATFVPGPVYDEEFITLVGR